MHFKAPSFSFGVYSIFVVLSIPQPDSGLHEHSEGKKMKESHQ